MSSWCYRKNCPRRVNVSDDQYQCEYIVCGGMITLDDIFAEGGKAAPPDDWRGEKMKFNYHPEREGELNG